MPDANTKRLVVFDLDGTLVDTLDDLTASANRLLDHERAPHVTADIVRPMVGDGVPVLVARLLAHAGISDREAEATRYFMTDYEANAAAASRLFDGARETLLALLHSGWRLAVCTNKPETAARKLLDALDVTPLLASLGGGDSYPTRKPGPGHLLGTIAAAGGIPARSIMVGDHRNDISAARAAGVASIFALWGFGTTAMAAGCSAEAVTITQVPGIAEALLAAPPDEQAVVPGGHLGLAGCRKLVVEGG